MTHNQKRLVFVLIPYRLGQGSGSRQGALKIFLDKQSFRGYIWVAFVVTKNIDMRFINVRELKSKTSEILRAAAGEDIIVTNHGKPVAVVSGIDGRDFEKIGFRGGAIRVRETQAPYRTEAVDYELPEAGKPTPATAGRSAWNPLKAVFWDYPELTEEATLSRRIQEARDSPIQDAFRWYLARFLERGRVVDAWRFFRLDEIRRIMPSLRLSSRAVAKWTRILEYYGNP